MSTTWRDDLLSIREQFAQTANTGCDLWHVALLEHSELPPGIERWGIVYEHEPLARRPAIGLTHVRRVSPVIRNEEGGFFGDPKLLQAFRFTADAAYRTLLDSPLRKVAEVVALPHSPREYSACWVGVLYHLAWETASNLLRADVRDVHERLVIYDDSEIKEIDRDAVCYYVSFAAIFRDLLTASQAAIDLLLRQARAEPSEVSPVCGPEGDAADPTADMERGESTEVPQATPAEGAERAPATEEKLRQIIVATEEGRQWHRYHFKNRDLHRWNRLQLRPQQISLLDLFASGNESLACDEMAKKIFPRQTANRDFQKAHGNLKSLLSTLSKTICKHTTLPQGTKLFRIKNGVCTSLITICYVRPKDDRNGAAAFEPVGADDLPETAPCSSNRKS